MYQTQGVTEFNVVIVCIALNILSTSVLDSRKPTDTSLACCTDLHCKNLNYSSIALAVATPSATSFAITQNAITM